MEKHDTKQNQSNLDLLLSRQIEMIDEIDAVELLSN